MTLATNQPLDDLGRWLRGDGLEIVLLVCGAILLVRGVRWLLQVVNRPVGSAEAEAADRHRAALSDAIGWVATAVVTVVAAILVADRLGLPLSTLVPTATVIGVALGFGAQRIVLDILSGFFLLAEHQLTPGDVVTISPPGTNEGVNGTVEEVTLRVTRLRTLHGEVVFIPNGEIRQVINQSIDWARLVIDIPLRPDQDIDQAIEVLRDVCARLDDDEAWADALIGSPEVLGLQTIGVGVIQVRITAKVRAAEQWRVGREFRRRIALGLSGAGIDPAQPVVVSRGAP